MRFLNKWILLHVAAIGALAFGSDPKPVSEEQKVNFAYVSCPTIYPIHFIDYSSDRPNWAPEVTNRLEIETEDHEFIDTTEYSAKLSNNGSVKVTDLKIKYKSSKLLRSRTVEYLSKYMPHEAEQTFLVTFELSSNQVAMEVDWKNFDPSAGLKPVCKRDIHVVCDEFSSLHKNAPLGIQYSRQSRKQDKKSKWE
jgi:hypothetical protein